MRLDELKFRQYYSETDWLVATPMPQLHVYFRTKSGTGELARPQGCYQFNLYDRPCMAPHGEEGLVWEMVATDAMTAQCVLLAMLEKIKGAGRTTNPAP